MLATVALCWILASFGSEGILGIERLGAGWKSASGASASLCNRVPRSVEMGAEEEYFSGSLDERLGTGRRALAAEHSSLEQP